MNNLIAALLALAFCGYAAAFLVMWANRDEWKKKADEEYTRRLEVIAAIALWRSKAELLKRKVDFWQGVCDKVVEERNELQDRVSALVCPHNDHVWEPCDVFDGAVRCKKCGRIKDASD